MKKMRIFELAKDLSVDTKDLLRIAKDLAISVENNMSMIDVHDIERIKKRFQKDSEKLPEQSSEETYVENERVSANVIRRRARISTPPVKPEEQLVVLEAKAEEEVLPEPEKKEEKKEKKKAQKVSEKKQMPSEPAHGTVSEPAREEISAQGTEPAAL
jgi:translation initiation factor IF-2